MSIVAPSASPASSSELSASVLKAIEGRIDPVKVTLGYRLAIMTVAALMVLLPIIYVSLIGFVGYGAYWHLVNNVGMLNVQVKGKGMLMVLLAYLAPGIIGAILVAFMLKPLFARRSRIGNKPQVVKREDEPLLYEYVDRLCDAVGSPRPTSILLDDEVNAAAALISGVWNPFRHDLMLIVGLPLVAGMTLKQFSGVLAHEFGHFSQGAGMRLGGIINSVNGWFAMVVFQRDEWDAKLESWSSGVDIRIGWVIYAARGCVWLTRKILYGLMFVGHAMSCRLSREMEFDADRHEARLTGSDTFAETHLRLPVLVGARRWAIGDLNGSYREGRLVDDFFGLISHRVEQIPDDTRQVLIDEQLKAKTGWFDTHPCDSDRIASAKREQAVGLLQLDAPASILFRDFGETCRVETLKFYRWQLGQDVSEKSLVPLDDLMARQKAMIEENQAVNRVLYGSYDIFWTFPFPGSLEPTTESTDEALARINLLRQKIRDHQPAYKELITQLHKSIDLFQECDLAESFLRSGLTVGPQVFSVPLTKIDEVQQTRAKTTQLMDDVNKSLEPILKDFADRIILPLKLLSVPSVAEKVPNAAKLSEESRELIIRAVQLRDHHPEFIDIFRARGVVRALLKNLESQPKNETLISGLLRAMSSGVSTLESIKEKLSAIPYPFDHIEEGITVSKYLIETLPPKDHLGAVDGTLSYVFEEGLKINTRIAGRLCLIAETVETTLGLPLGELPDPE